MKNTKNHNFFKWVQNFTLVSYIFFGAGVKADDITKNDVLNTPKPKKASLNLGRETVQRNDLRLEHLVAFEPIVLSDTSIGVNFTAGVDDCYGYRAILIEKDDSIGIAVVEGVIPNPAHACFLQAIMAHFVLHTKHLIGNRQIIPLTAAEVQLKK